MNAFKVLIIGDEPLIKKVLEMWCKTLGFVKENILCSGFKEALKKFREFQPTHIIITDYDESREGFGEGADIWNDLSLLLDGEKAVLLGYGDCDLGCFLKMPPDKDNLQRYLLGSNSLN